MKKKLKEIFNYIVRVCLFILLNRHGYIILLYILPISIFNKILGTDSIFLIGIIVLYINFYLTAKLCGLFKKLDNLNIFINLPIIILINTLFYISECTTVQIFPLKFSYQSQGIFYTVIPCFILYKIFYFLGKKFPNTCGKIGYYSSLEYWKKLIVKNKK